MRSTLSLLVVLGLVGALASLSACQTTECGPGTIDRGGECEPADLTVGTAQCGLNTELRGDQCVPKLPPTECDPATTQPETDPRTGITKCIGTGGGGCSAPLACPKPADGKQTICGQIYDFVDNKPFAADGATGAKCAPGATEGPCALSMVAIDPIAVLRGDPDPRYATGGVYLDDCGRYRVLDVTLRTGVPYVVLKIDDAADLTPNPAGRTATTFAGVLAAANTIVKDFETWIVEASVVTKWTTVATELSLSKGIYAGIFRRCNPATGVCPGGSRFDTQAGVKFTSIKAGRAYFFASNPGHETISPNATVTNANGTALTTILDTDLMFTGEGGLPNTCVWEKAVAGKFPGGVFFQVFRPTNAPSQTCTQ